MMNENRSWLNRKKVIGVCAVIAILSLIVYLTFLYRHIESTRTMHFAEMGDWIKKTANLSTIDKMYHFQGDEAYYIAYGQDEAAKKWIVFKPEKDQDPDNVLTFSADDFSTQKEVEESWQKECHGCKLKRSGPAMINQEPLWEIAYLDREQRYVIEYISLKDRTVYEKLKLHLKYNMKG